MNGVCSQKCFISKMQISNVFFYAKEVGIALIFHIFFLPQWEQEPVWTQIIPPHSGQAHVIFSLPINFLIPIFLMDSRFSSMLILYLVRYLTSKCFKMLQGYFLHLKQNLAFPFWNSSQVLILHTTRVTDLLASAPLQPGHLFFLVDRLCRYRSSFRMEQYVKRYWWIP